MSNAQVILIAVGLAGLLDSCSPVSPRPDPQTVDFPTYAPGMAVSSAVLDGRLVRDAGCLWIATRDQRYLALWPDGYRPDFDDVGVVVLDASGEQVGVEGSLIVVGGGEWPIEEVSTTARSSVPPRCLTGSAWLVSSVLTGPVPPG